MLDNNTNNTVNYIVVLKPGEEISSLGELNKHLEIKDAFNSKFGETTQPKSRRSFSLKRWLISLLSGDD